MRVFPIRGRVPHLIEKNEWENPGEGFVGECFSNYYTGVMYSVLQISRVCNLWKCWRVATKSYLVSWTKPVNFKISSWSLRMGIFLTISSAGTLKSLSKSRLLRVNGM